MLKIIIPLAGTSDFFVNSGYHYPKPLIEIKVSGAIINESTADFTPAQIVKRMNIFQKTTQLGKVK